MYDAYYNVMQYNINGYKCRFYDLPTEFINREQEICNAISFKYKDFDSMVNKYWEEHLISHNSDRGCLDYPAIEISLETVKHLTNGWIQFKMKLWKSTKNASKRPDCYQSCGKINVILDTSINDESIN